MRKGKTLVALFLAFICVFSTVGCRQQSGPNIDKNKSQLSIANENAGLGDAWLRKIADDFEAFYAETSFEEGKMGVQVHINNYDVTAMNGSSILSKIEYANDAIYFGEAISPQDMANSGLVMDITDIISAPLTEFGENESILDKMDDYLVSAISNQNNRYFVLPFYEGFYQMYYDAELFEKNGYYFKKDAVADNLNVLDLNVSIDHLFVYDETDEKSVGPDLIAGTIDDGLPVTYKDFLALTRFIAVDSATGVVPVIWTGQYLDYMTSYCVSLWANNEGYDGMLKNLTLSGTLDNLIDVDDNGNIITLAPVELTVDNGYMLQKQRSRYETLDFLQDFLGKTYNYDPKSFGSGYSHTGAQDQFLLSRKSSSIDDIAMLIEGSWWNCEATSTFDSMALGGSQWSRQERKIAVMPPLRSDRANSETTLVSLNDAYCLMNNNLTGVTKTIAEKFFRYCHTDKSLATFAKYVGMTRAFDYSLDGQDYTDLSYYAKSLYELKKNAKVIYPETKVAKILNNEDFFSFNTFGFTTVINGSTHTNPFRVYNNDKGVTAEKYFNGMYTSTYNRWSGLV